jgi:hypothetical protein
MMMRLLSLGIYLCLAAVLLFGQSNVTGPTKQLWLVGDDSGQYLAGVAVQTSSQSLGQLTFRGGSLVEAVGGGSWNLATYIGLKQLWNQTVKMWVTTTSVNGKPLVDGELLGFVPVSMKVNVRSAPKSAFKQVIQATLKGGLGLVRFRTNGGTAILPDLLPVADAISATGTIVMTAAGSTRKQLSTITGAVLGLSQNSLMLGLTTVSDGAPGPILVLPDFLKYSNGNAYYGSIGWSEQIGFKPLKRYSPDVAQPVR